MTIFPRGNVYDRISKEKHLGPYFQGEMYMTVFPRGNVHDRITMYIQGKDNQEDDHISITLRGNIY